jgi:HrpA-like RNA helicase
MQEYQLPEMLRVGLEDLVLQILLLDLGEPSIFLAKAVNPPTALAMRNSLNLLEGLGAVECEWGDLSATGKRDATTDTGNPTCMTLNVTSGLTALGFHLATLPVDPRVGKMMIYGALFGCIDPALTIAASMSARNPFMSPFDKRDEADAARKEFATEGSDHLTTLSAFNEWKDVRRTQGDRASQHFLRESFLSRMTLFQMEDLRKQFAGLLVDIGFLPKKFRLSNGLGRGRDSGRDQHNHATPPTMANANGSNVHLVKAVLCAGLYPNIIVAPNSGPKDKKAVSGQSAFQSLKGDVYLHPSTISFSEKKLNSRYCCYHEIVKTTKTYVRDATPVSAFALLLFGGSLKVYHTHGVVTVDDWLHFRIAAKTATLVKHLRAQMESMLLRKIVTPEEDITGSSEGIALIHAVSTLLEREIKDTSDRMEPVRPQIDNEFIGFGNGHPRDTQGGRGNSSSHSSGSSGRGRQGRGGGRGGRGRGPSRGGGRGRQGRGGTTT